MQTKGTLGDYQQAIEMSVRLGKMLEPYTFQGQDITDTKAWARFYEMFVTGRVVNIAPLFVQQMMQGGPMAMEGQFAARWLQQAMPVVEIGHKLAAALICTTPRPEARELFRSPWKAWMIRVPEGLIQMLGEDRQTLEDVTTIQVYNYVSPETVDDPNWNYIVRSKSMFIHAPRLGAERLFDDQGDFLTDDPDRFPGSVQPSEIDRRASSLARRLIRGITLMLADPEERQRSHQPEGTSSKAIKARVAKYGAAAKQGIWIDRYVLGTPVKVDLRDTVKRYLHGERASPNVRTLVRGHWKVQPYGTGRQQKKTIWIEPYFRGGEELPIATRPHVMGDELADRDRTPRSNPVSDHAELLAKELASLPPLDGTAYVGVQIPPPYHAALNAAEAWMNDIIDDTSLGADAKGQELRRLMDHLRRHGLHNVFSTAMATQLAPYREKMKRVYVIPPYQKRTELRFDPSLDHSLHLPKFRP